MAVQNQQKPKPEGKISYSVLRNFSIHYPIARACIDYLKTKVLKLEFDIVPENPDEKVDVNDPRVKVIREFFKHPMGKRSHYRQMIESVIEDYLVIGAFSLERIRTRGGQFMNEVKLVDSSTIQIMVDEHGRLPDPPNYAYKQIIQGSVKAELTQDELLYVPRAYRSNSPYGLSPIESIIIQAESALQGAMFSLRYFTDGNVPEGFGEMPEGWKLSQIREFQDYFDAVIAGNPTMQRKIKMVPKGFNYKPTKDPAQIGFERFEGWLLQQTCSVFGVPPQDIGYTYQVNKATGEVQQDLGEERGMRPLAQMFEQVFTDVIADDMNIEGLKFQYQNLDPVDAKSEAEVQAIKIRSGVLGIDEARADEGREPLGIGNYIDGTPHLVDALIAGKDSSQQVKEDPKADPKANDEETVDDPGDEDDTKDVDEKQKGELKLWAKQSRNALKQGRPFKKFVSNVLEGWMVDEIFAQLEQVKDKADIEKVFDPYFNDTMQTVHTLEQLTHVLTRLNTQTS